VPSGSQDQTSDKIVGHVVCPHCWHRFSAVDILWIAKHEDLRGDPIAGPDEMVRFRASRFNVSGAALDARGLPCEDLACPVCHLYLPRALLESQPLILSIAGDSASGKSYFLATMSWELRRTLPRRFSVAFNDADPLANKILTDNEQILFMPGDPEAYVALEKTEQDGHLYRHVQLDDRHTAKLPKPFLFTLRPMGEHPNAGAATEMTRVLCFYDNAGETFQPGQDSATAPGTQHLARSKVLFFVFDPLRDPRFRERCIQISQDPQLSDALRPWRQATVLTEAAIRIRKHGNLTTHRKLDKPLIVLVAKSDVWGYLVDEDFRVEPLVSSNNDENGPAKVDINRIESVSRKLRDLLLNLSPEFVAAAEDNFQPVLYVPVSPLGGSPVRKEGLGGLAIRPKDIAPRWVTAPILYAFAKWSTGLIARQGNGM